MTKDTPSQEVNLIYRRTPVAGPSRWARIRRAPWNPLRRRPRTCCSTSWRRRIRPPTPWSPFPAISNMKRRWLQSAMPLTVGTDANPDSGLPPVHPETQPQDQDRETRHSNRHISAWAYPDCPCSIPKRFIMDILNVILGEGMSSRLFTEIRDNLGLAYSIYSYVDHLLDSGALPSAPGWNPDNLRKTVSATLEQLTRFKDETVSAAEVSQGQRTFERPPAPADGRQPQCQRLGGRPGNPDQQDTHGG